MSGLFESYLRPLLFRLPAEAAHELGLNILRISLRSRAACERARARYGIEPFSLDRFGLRFDSPIGVAAGFDKNGRVVDQLAALGFGHVEVGTVTHMPQPGNEKPRLFRLPADNALLNRLGFNNEGVEAVIQNLQGIDRRCVVGINIGKNRDVPVDEALGNYLAAFETVHPAADYLTVNVSSPNTPNLRQLQEADQLVPLLSALQQKNAEMGRKPLLVKIAPDLTDEGVEAITGVATDLDISGIIATNTTISRAGLKTANIDSYGAGGVSGKPLAAMARRVVGLVHRYSGGRMPVIGVGGIYTAEDAFEMIAAGACLLQAYTGFVYVGPSYARDINKGLHKILRERGFASLDEAVGSAADRLPK